MVQTDQHPRAAGTGDGRQVAGGSAFGTLSLVVLEVVILGFLALRHSLAVSDSSTLC